MTWTLILYSFLTASPGQPIQKVYLPVGDPYPTLTACQEALRIARLEAKGKRQKQVGGTCEQMKGVK